ncbi:WxL protein peptidoglycan domain-containing protein [Streptomyces griseofuscus]|uniref:WxL protein peptidoglycan domain-containing protein n=1 Tax=Streptomyces griseofuscus TaxID=146922 RepID=UPI0034182272
MRKAYVVVVSLLLAVLPVVPARAADNGSWSVYPVAAQAAARPYFYLSADPGQTLADKVAVQNRTGEPLTFRLYAADAYNTPRDGGFAVRTADETMRGVGAWARLARSRITVPGHRTVTVPFTLRVPTGAEPGDHPGAIVALDERTEPGGGKLALGIRRAVGARVYLRVSGPTLPALAVSRLSVGRHRPLLFGTGTATVSYTLRNTGNVTLRPSAQLTARGLFGRTLLERRAARVPAELLPGQSVRLTETWRGTPVLDRAAITVSARARGASASAGASFYAVPWPPLVVLVLAVVAVVIAWRRRSRSGEGSVTRREHRFAVRRGLRDQGQ